MRTIIVALVLGLAFCVVAPPARACGGLFCNPPNPWDPPPVAQAAENVLFAIERDAEGRSVIEAHIQIVYGGTADAFSWVVPVPVVPELAVGTDAVFRFLEPATRPSFPVEWRDDGTCAVPPPGGSRCACDGAGGSGGGGGGSGGYGEACACVDVAFRGDVGPFDAAVLKADEPDALETWLTDNGYRIPDNSRPIIADYVRRGIHFVALKLAPGRGVGEIRPIVLRMPSDEACVPLKLTAIAAVPHMAVNVWVLGEARAVPLGFHELEIDLARLDWFHAAANYQDLVREAADEAGGNAFMTEFSGPSRGVGAGPWSLLRFDEARLAAQAEPPAFMQELRAQNVPPDGVLYALLRKYIPLPAALADMGINEASFYANIESLWERFGEAFTPFDAAGFAYEIATSVIPPLDRVGKLFDRHPVLTRLTTFISPEEMLADPYFVLNPDLPPVPQARTAVATRHCQPSGLVSACRALVDLKLPDGRVIWFRPRRDAACSRWAPPEYDRGLLGGLPALEVAWARGTKGGGAPAVDQRARIADVVERHNRLVLAGTGSSGGMCGVAPSRPSLWLITVTLVLGTLALVGRRTRRTPPGRGQC